MVSDQFKLAVLTLCNTGSNWVTEMMLGTHSSFRRLVITAELLMFAGGKQVTVNQPTIISRLLSTVCLPSPRIRWDQVVYDVAQWVSRGNVSERMQHWQSVMQFLFSSVQFSGVPSPSAESHISTAIYLYLKGFISYPNLK